MFTDNKINYNIQKRKRKRKDTHIKVCFLIYFVFLCVIFFFFFVFGSVEQRFLWMKSNRKKAKSSKRYLILKLVLHVALLILIRCETLLTSYKLNRWCDRRKLYEEEPHTKHSEHTHGLQTNNLNPLFIFCD